MLRRRRLLLFPALVAALSLALVACGNDSEGDGFPGSGVTKDRLEAVTISGDVGSAPEVKWTAGMAAGNIEAKTITEGDGDPVAAGANVMAQIWIGNGYTKDLAFSTYDEKRAELVTNDDQLPEFLKPIADAKIGSRIAVTGSAETMFGEGGNPQLGIGNMDTVLVVVDLVSTVLEAAVGDATPAPDWMPKLKQRNGVPTSFDFEGTPAPTAELRRVQLIQGTGARVETGQTIAVRYLGQAVGGDQPFDENFGDTGTGPPTAFGIGTGQVIKGWDQGLDGIPVGSRVLLEIPPDLAYGADGRPDTGIPANATLVFLIDVLGAA